ncbi:MAG: VWA domain-containing protein [Planctomycetota bacterium]|nr:VWA domain-containing protein [Planctomycetota bacterium]
MPFATVSAAGKKSSAPEFKSARPEFLKKFKSKRPTDRLAALAILEPIPSRESAELLFQSAFTDDAPEVREATVALLQKWRDEPQVGSTLLDLLTKFTKKSGMDQHTYTVLKGLGGTENRELQELILRYMDDALGTPKSNQGLIHSLADNLGTQADAEALQTLKLFSRAKFAGKNFGYRRCVYQGIVHVPGDATVDYLIESLPELRGQVKFDVVTHLIRTTGQNFGGDATKWLGWWIESKRKVPPRNDRINPSVSMGRGYYGIPIGAERVVFVLDASGSMRGGKIEAAKRELSEAIQSLTPDVYFGVITFANRVTVLHPTLVIADEKNKRQAIYAVMDRNLGGGTSSYDAIEAAFELGPEAIYFVSDGAPTSGKIVSPPEIVNAIASWNHVRRVSIHSIGIDTNDTTTAIFSRFMKGIAGMSWGEYVAVDK